VIELFCSSQGQNPNGPHKPTANANANANEQCTPGSKSTLKNPDSNSCTCVDPQRHAVTPNHCLFKPHALNLQRGYSEVVAAVGGRKLKPTIPSASSSPPLVIDTRLPMMPSCPTFIESASRNGISKSEPSPSPLTASQPRQRVNCRNSPESETGLVRSPGKLYVIC
jgi:hypothetical protein